MKRIYTQQTGLEENSVELMEDCYHYLFRVLRAKVGEEFILFNGDGFDYYFKVGKIGKKTAQALLINKKENRCESNIYTILLQGISKGDKMDFVMQKAVELGVNEIIPVFGEYTAVKLDAKRQLKKYQHWQKIIISACEQCGRAIIPKLHQPLSLSEAVNQLEADTKLFLHPYANDGHKVFGNVKKPKRVMTLIGPEGGLSDKDIIHAEQAGFSPIKLGNRILRTETATLVGLAALQMYWGDFNV